MKVHRIVFCLILIVCLTSVSSAYTVKTVAINPSIAPHGGDSISVKAVIAFPASEQRAFDPDHDLRFSTDLSNAVWTFTFSGNGIDDLSIPASGSRTSIDGGLLASASNVKMKCTVTVGGIVPSGTDLAEITAIEIQETDANGALVTGGDYRKLIHVDHSASLTARIQDKEADLAQLRLLIESKAMIGADMSAVEATYQTAAGAIASAKTARSESAADAHLAAAHAAMAEAYLLFNDAWADYQLSITTTPTPTMVPCQACIVAPATTISRPTTIPTLQKPKTTTTIAKKTTTLMEIRYDWNQTADALPDPQDDFFNQIVTFIGSVFGLTPQP
jgi:hypothetical protein